MEIKSTIQHIIDRLYNANIILVHQRDCSINRKRMIGFDIAKPILTSYRIPFFSDYMVVNISIPKTKTSFNFGTIRIPKEYLSSVESTDLFIDNLINLWKKIVCRRYLIARYLIDTNSYKGKRWESAREIVHELRLYVDLNYNHI